METLDAVAGEFERIQRGAIAGFCRGVDFLGADAQATGIEIEPVELSRRLDQRRVAARGDVVDDGAGGKLDIGRYLALHPQEKRESLGEIGAVAVEADRHGGSGGSLLNGAATTRRQPLNSPLPSFRDGPKDQTRNLEIPGSR